MIYTIIRRSALIAAFAGTVTLGAAYLLDDVLVEWEEQAQIQTVKTKELARLEVQAMATAQAQQAQLTSLEIARQELDLTLKTQDVKRENERAEASLTHSLNRESQLAWVWTTSQGVLYGLVGIVPVAVGGLILWRVVVRKRQADEDRRLIDVVASGTIPVSRDFLLNNPQAVFEWATIRAEMEARAKLASAEKVAMPSLTTYSPTMTYSPTNPQPVAQSAMPQLASTDQQAQGGQSAEIYETFQSLGLPVYVSLDATGPQVETYAIKPGHKAATKGRLKRVTVGEIERHAKDIAVALGVAGVRMTLAAGFVSCEVPRGEREFVSLTDVLKSGAWTKATETMALPLPLGTDTRGRYVVADLATMPHLLVGGATLQGKSVSVKAIIYALLTSFDPQEVRLTLIDPKKVEFAGLRGAPHVTSVITDMDHAANSLVSLVSEMERRNDLFSKSGAVNIAQYNKKADSPLPYLIVIIDEMADLMMTHGDEVDSQIERLAQKARSAGIHMILATQRPSAEVITGIIRSNVPARLALTTTTGTDSRIILDETGAETLTGKGDSLYKSPEQRTIRLQAPFVSDAQMSALIDTLLSRVKTLCDNESTFDASSELAKNDRRNSEEVPKSARKVPEESAKARLQRAREEQERAKLEIVRDMVRDCASVSEMIEAVFGSNGGTSYHAKKKEIKRLVASVNFSGS